MFCKYCEATDNIVGFDLRGYGGSGILDIRFDVENFQIDVCLLYVDGIDDIDYSIDIKFCPFCGKYLLEKDAEKAIQIAAESNLSNFKITRIINGKSMEIKLTEHEIYKAGDYYDDECYRKDIVSLLEEREDDGEENEKELLYGYTVKEIRADASLMDNIFYKYKKYRDNFDTEWSEAARDAIEDTLRFK